MKHLKSAFNLLMVIPATIGLLLMVPFIIILRLINIKLVRQPGYTDIYTPFYDQLDPYHGPAAWEASKAGVPQAALDLYALHWAFTEVTAGGFSQFFNSPTGLLAPEARDGFAAIGMEEVAATLQSAMDRLATPFPLELEARQQRIKFDTARMKFEETARFKAQTGNHNLIGGAALYLGPADAYAAKHRQTNPA
ncbi:DMP19 family protein [Abyssibius alkaniclasticus]|uniref:DMP19 family protein n=1 Tax=Abyssibius alkaniclasticus TaxID=2881234 RepID=UPI002364A160|nr:DUF4375 domain-containing protein [Abyssibius alkaniclasticus]UPH72035.1 DMP19 family protein [Abyssibius alkaniclasticus]